MVHSLDDPQEVKAIDKSGMLEMVDRIPGMIEEAVELGNKVKVLKAGRVDNIVIAGMGGSAVGGDIVRCLLNQELDIPIVASRHYNLPRYIKKKSLLFVSSYSGNTEETISAFEQGFKRGCYIICITSDGKLKSQAEERKIPVVTVPSGIQPRAALPYLLIPILVILEKMGLAENIKPQIDETVILLKGLRGSSLPKELASTLSGKIPIILASMGLTEAAGFRWKTQLNENSKVTTLFNVFPELNHNELVNLGDLKKGEHNFSLVILRDKDDHPRVQKRIEITKKLLDKSFEKITEIWSSGNSKLARLMSLVMIGDYLSVYLAVRRGVDPTPVEIIEKLKKELGK